VANGRVLREGPFDDLWIQPASGDAGGALGTALFTWHQLMGEPRAGTGRDQQQGSLLGPAHDDDAIAACLRAADARYTRHDDEESACDAIAALLAQGKVVGHVAGRAEFGPRALGNRSILGDPRSPRMQSLMNQKIKFRESFRPFAPAVLAERAHEYFDMRPGEQSPYMLLVAKVRPEQRLQVDDTSVRGLSRLQQPRSTVPAVTHVDDSARVQTVDRERNPRFHRIISRFADRTGCPVVINTSFNVRGEPIVNSPQDAFRCFMATDMDALAMGPFLLLKQDQPQATREARAAYLDEFALD
jgi:carbamoyltransferase